MDTLCVYEGRAETYTNLIIPRDLPGKIQNHIYDAIISRSRRGDVRINISRKSPFHAVLATSTMLAHLLLNVIEAKYLSDSFYVDLDFDRPLPARVFTRIFCMNTKIPVATNHTNANITRGLHTQRCEGPVIGNATALFTTLGQALKVAGALKLRDKHTPQFARPYTSLSTSARSSAFVGNYCCFDLPTRLLSRWGKVVVEPEKVGRFKYVEHKILGLDREIHVIRRGGGGLKWKSRERARGAVVPVASFW